MITIDESTMKRLLEEHQIEDPQGFWGPLPGYARMYNTNLSYFADDKGQGFQMETPDKQNSIQLRVGETVEKLVKTLFDFIGDVGGAKQNTMPV